MAASQSAAAPDPDPLPDIITTNLVNWFDFGKSQCWNGTSTTINDLTSNNYSGTITGPSANWSKSTSNGGYLDLVNGESTKSQVSRNDSNAFAGVETGDFTIELWINMSMGDGPNMHMWMDFPNVTDNARILWKNNANHGYIMRVSPGFSSNGQWQWRSDVGGFSSGYTGWKHFVMSRSSGTIKVYLNDDEKDSWSNSHDFDVTSGASSPQYAIGNDDSSSPSSWMKARIAVYRLYVGKGLSSSEVEDNFDEEKSRFGVN